MEEFIEKLIARLEEERKPTDFGYTSISLSKAIQIINELAEEYKGGWIPVSERLPEVKGIYLVAHRKNTNLLVDTWYFNGYDFNQVSETDVIAWQPLPEPYKE